ncbi:outer dynein arm-docking complex subunit 4-like [Gigantopelta aegis]|uniref:outer dynein arm-docking complex subunit 4-like n=1 Tax=Gigantopelta aegis TaxID=1735272 RepID=UPI001B88CA52|nr:outer dynein arm-docking complex subunit 4-like [Gigantopelta aegis]
MPGAGRGRGREDDSDIGTDQEAAGTFETLRDEGEHFVHVKQYKKAIESFTKALEMHESDPTCLVRRAHCHLMLGNADHAFDDAQEALKSEEEGKMNIKALFLKAEAFYQKGDFENSLVFFHRGNKLRPELQEFRLGIQKSQEAINNSIGGPESVKLTLDGDLSFFEKHDDKAKLQQKARYSKPLQRKEEKKDRKKPDSSSSDSKTTKELLGELFQDKAFLEKLFDEMTTPNNDTGEYVKDRACDGLEYLNKRADFWRQQKPMYARKRDRQQQSKSQSAKSTGMDPMQYVLLRLEQIDEAQAQGKHGESLKLCHKTMKRVEEWSERQLKNKNEVLANLHSCMGNAYLEMEKFKKALEHHEQDLEIGKE